MKLKCAFFLAVTAIACALGNLLAPQEVSASVDAVTPWPAMPPIVSNSANGTLSGKFTVGAGNNRVLLVAVATEYTSGNPAIAVGAVTYGGTALTNIALATNTTGLNKIWVGYLVLGTATAPSAATLAVTNTGTAGLTATYVTAAVYKGIDQTTPITGSGSASGSTATLTTSNFAVSGMNGNNGLAVFISNYNGATLNTTGTATKVRDYAGANMNIGAGQESVVTNAADNLTVTASAAVSGVLAGIGLNPAAKIATNSTCGDCHGYPPPDGSARNVPSGQFTGSHDKHAGGNANQYSFICTQCHYNNITNYHSTGYRNITGSSVPGNAYSGTKKVLSTNANGTGTCTNVTCHSSGRTTRQYATSPAWGSAGTCLSCHGGRNSGTGNYARSANNFSMSTTHSQHLKYQTTEINCNMCHGKTAANHTALKDYTGVQYHGNGSKNILFTNIAYGSMTSYKSPLSGSAGTTKTCNNTACHGGQSRGSWQDTAATNSDHTCAHCHGTATTTVAQGNADRRLFAPGFRKTGTSTDQLKSSADLRVGAHYKHLSSAYTRNIKCNECHLVPAKPFDAATNHTLNNLRYNSGTLTFAQASTATVVIGVVAGSNPARNNAVTYVNGTGSTAAQCTTAYCHGNRLKTGDTSGSLTAPYWNVSSMINYTDPAVACGRCHGVPPSTGTSALNHSGKTLTGANACSNCHSTVVDSSGKIINKALHINGQVDGGGHAYPYPGSIHDSLAVPITNCTTCHTNTSGTYPVTRPTKPDCRSCHVKASPGTGCSTCHGRSTTGGVALNYSAARPNGGISGGFPNYSGSHTAHVIKKGISCDGCHNGYGTGHDNHGFSNTSGATYSRTNFKKTAFTIGGTPTYARATMTCSNLTGCHGTAIWGGRLGCVDCHSASITRTKGSAAGKSLAPVTTEFGLAWGHKKSGRTNVTDADCIVCHLEGVGGTTNRSTTYHGNGNIDLRDPDGTGDAPITDNSNAAFTFARFSTSFAAGSRTSTGNTSNKVDAVLTLKFCMKCHDANGATNTTARTSGGTAAMPFGGVALGANYTAANGAIGTQGTIDVATQFATTNSSAHPVLGARNKDFPTAARMNDPYKPTGTRGTSGTLSQGVVIYCFDCHNVTGQHLTIRTVSAHGNDVTIPGRLTTTGTTFTVGTNDVTFCNECHIGYDASAVPHHGTGSALASTTNNGMLNYLRYACNVCHSSGYNTAVVRPIRAQDVHGNNALPTTGLAKESGSRWAGASVGTPAQVNAKPYAFIRDTEILTTHSPRQIGTTVYSPNCTMGNSTPNCSRANQTFTGGGTY